MLWSKVKALANLVITIGSGAWTITIHSSWNVKLITGCRDCQNSLLFSQQINRVYAKIIEYNAIMIAWENLYVHSTNPSLV